MCQVLANLHLFHLSTALMHHMPERMCVFVYVPSWRGVYVRIVRWQTVGCPEVRVNVL